MKTSFSRRHGYGHDLPITVREDAPEAIRAALLSILTDDFDMQYSTVREIICPVLHIFPDSNNWSEVPNVRDEVIHLLSQCAWYRIYDICEAIYKYWSAFDREKEFADRLNEVFSEYGVGWQLKNGLVVTRGPKEFERAVTKATTALKHASQDTARNELQEARRDLSRRPSPDITGAIQHSMAALECAARHLSGSKETLGQILKKQATSLGIPKPLDEALEKIWGHASEKARHLREGAEPKRREAELVLMLTSAIIGYLLEQD